MQKLFVFLFILSFSSSSFACSCAEFNIEKAVDAADSIYFAEAISANIVSEANGYSYILAVMKVQKVLKGQISSSTTEITTGLGGGDCGVPITLTKNYIIFARNETKNIGVCGGSKVLNYFSHSYVDPNELEESIKKALVKNQEKKQ